MGFTENMLDILGFRPSEFPLRFRYTVFGDKGGYFEGVKGIKSFCENEIIFSVQKGEVSVIGKNLHVVKYCGGDAAVSGGITEVKLS